VRDPILNGHFGHLQGFLERLRSVIERGKDVAMDVDH
jgi:hypothetical protein